MHHKHVVRAGEELKAGGKVLIMLHGRGGSAEDILSLSAYLKVKDFTLLAPQATNHTWYPFSFLAPPAQNEPWLSSALSLLQELVNEVLESGIPSENIYFLGFSQGACLTLEFAARNARRYGGVVAFTGGLIGDKINTKNYSGDFAHTPVFMGSSDPDPHVPVERVHASTQILRNLHADVTNVIYPEMGHMINQDEIENANKLVFTANNVKA